MANRIDIVITWVDGSDEKWLNLKNQYLPSDRRIDASNVRYRDWGLLKYLLRSIEKFAPWAGNIFLVTADQVPDFIRNDNPKLKFVSHSDFMPKDYLPTFSSAAIELNLYKIPGLSEEFVYFNDDCLLTKMTTPEDFFENGLPKDMHIQNVIAPINDVMPQIQANNMRIVNKMFSKRDFMKNNFKKWFNFKYGPNMLRNILLYKWNYYTGFYDPHLPMSLTKKMFEDLWKFEFKAMHHCCMNKFKSPDDINIWLPRYIYLAKGDFVPRKASFGRYTDITNDNSAIIKYIRGQKQSVICVNDSVDCTDFENQKKLLLDAFESILPEKSSFEI